ncbi:hypothetical protein [Psychrobacter sp. GP33]|uniref:hypothetical protein n=1 Tax=Psychrobacter sp. GP33 TaxID=2758709 RepID=UPI0015F8AB34|nr:hypothetical protein [Psychrobacter sp. GP33]
MKSLLLSLTALSLLSTSAAYACDAHHNTKHQAPQQTITTKHKAKIHTTVNKKLDVSKAHPQASNQSNKTIRKVTI